jgi:catechol 2,3-dioxygenase-like lactoylglutathione lyase family enzyme
MHELLAEKMIDDFEKGRISRRQLVATLAGLGAALASGQRGLAQPADESEEPSAGQGSAPQSGPTFQANGLDHIALDVTDVARSREFYEKHLGLRTIRGDDRALFMGADRDFFLTLFRADEPRMHHYCYSIENYNADEAVQMLADAGLRPRRTGNRVYFPDPDGLTVQVAG